MSALKDKLLLVATDLFQTRGINSTGVDTIVAVAGDFGNLGAFHPAVAKTEIVEGKIGRASCRERV